MKKLRVNLPGREYDILIEQGILDRCGDEIRPLVKGDLAVIITDSNVEPLYARRVAKSLMHAGFRTALLEVPAGETSKSPAFTWSPSFTHGFPLRVIISTIVPSAEAMISAGFSSV